MADFYTYRNEYAKSRRRRRLVVVVLVLLAAALVLAAAGGQVTRAGYHYSYGNYVVIDHGLDSNGHRWTTLYAHLAAITVREGQAVAQGESIGMVGSTGN